MILAVRYLVVLLYFIAVAILGILVCLVRPFHADNSCIVGRAFGWLGPWLLGVEIKVENEEILDTMQPGVIVANHQSNLDLFLLGHLVPRRTASIGKSSLKFFPIFGQLYWLAGNIMIDRSNASQSIGALNTVSEAINNDRRSIWIFAEGTRSKGRGLGRFKKGAFHVAVQAKCPLYMVAASSYVGHLDFRRWKSGAVHIRILPPIDASEYQIDDVDDLLQRAHSSIAETIRDLDSRTGTLIVEG